MTKTGKIDVDAFWERIDHLVDIHEMTLNDLQTMIGKTGTYLYVARCHKSLPSVALIAKMADTLNCTVDYLIGRISITSDDPELDEVIDMWRFDPSFKAMVKPIVQTLRKR